MFHFLGGYTLIRLLNKDALNKLKLFYLLKESEEIQTISSVSKKFNLDKRTTLRLLQAFQQDIIQFQLEQDIHLNFQNERNIIFELANSFDPQFLYVNYLEQSINFNACLDIFNQDFTNISQFSAKHYQSVSTTKRSLDSFKRLMKQYELSLDLAKNQMIVGKEHQIRYFYYTFFWESYSSTQWPFPEIDLHTLQVSLHEITKDFKNLPIPDINKMIVWVAVSLIRINQGYVIDYEEDYQHFKNHTISYNQFQQFALTLAETLSLPAELLTTSELQFLYFSLATTSAFSHHEFYSVVDIDTNHEFLPVTASQLWIKRFCSFFDISLTPNEYFYLYTNLLSLHSRALYLIGPSNVYGILDNGSNTFKRSPDNYAKIKKFCLKLEKEEPYFPLIFKRNNQLIPQYLILVMDLLKRKEQPVSIYLASGLNVIERDSLQAQLQDLNPFPLKFSEHTEDIDLIVTDVSIPKIFSKEIPVFHWNPIPTKKDLKLVIAILSELHYAKNKK
ncbi:hypothetical protein CKN81_03425 [Carnobacterium divergens]|nr:hypothetical protein CKN81_03425 [Carnobacterium divergens]